MNEYILVEFLCRTGDYDALWLKLGELGEKFELIKDEYEYENEDGYTEEYIRMSGKISSMAASILRLRDSFLADRMRISYIPNELKDKYRK